MWRLAVERSAVRTKLKRSQERFSHHFSFLTTFQPKEEKQEGRKEIGKCDDRKTALESSKAAII